jgi:hypothetical protein
MGSWAYSSGSNQPECERLPGMTLYVGSCHGEPPRGEDFVRDDEGRIAGVRHYG